ncbi:MAG: DUF86 domain-containing protein [Geopsychrobacter sp.]|nr:DUF86 domain-containing protein [Geopsychrobacter sp.]
MPRDLRKYLYDIAQVCQLLREFTHDKTLADYSANAMLRAAVERQFEIIGKALKQFVERLSRTGKIDQSLQPYHLI